MRTDAVNVSAEAAAALRKQVAEVHGDEYVADPPNRFKAGAGAQEAHEAIRPTVFDPRRRPSLEGDAARLYELICRRATQSQAAPARIRKDRVVAVAGRWRLALAGVVVLFPGFEAVWPPEREDISVPRLEKGASLTLVDVALAAKRTKAPQRFTQATLVRELEKRGIGRPSTLCADDRGAAQASVRRSKAARSGRDAARRSRGRGGRRRRASGRRAVLVRRRRALRGRALARARRGVPRRRRGRLELGRRGVSGAGARVALQPLRRDLGVRFGRALGVVRPWVDVGAVIGSGSHFPARPAQVAAAEPAFDARAIRRSTSCPTCRLGVPPALPARSARVWTSGGGTAFGSPFVGRGPCWARASGARPGRRGLRVGGRAGHPVLRLADAGCLVGPGVAAWFRVDGAVGSSCGRALLAALRFSR